MSKNMEQRGAVTAAELNTSIDQAFVDAWANSRPVEKVELPKVEENASGGVWSKESQSELLVFNVSLYKTLLDEATVSLQDRNAAMRLVRQAVINDGYGLLTEKVSAEKESGQYIFDLPTRVGLQLTPPTHRYIQTFHSQTGEQMMVCPEHLEIEKDVLETITPWRRGLDKRVMGIVREQFFQAEVGDKLIWGSPPAEEQEDPLVKRFNGLYGYYYFGEVVEEEGLKMLKVQDFKNNSDAASYELLLNGIAEEVYKDNGERSQKIDDVMTTVAKSSKEWSRDTIWRAISQAKRLGMGNSSIFDLSVDTVITAQNDQLHKLAKEGATEVGDWIVSEMEKGTDMGVIQSQVRGRFVTVAKRLFIAPGVTTPSYLSRTILSDYSGSEGDFCGDWTSGESYSQKSVTAALEATKGVECRCGFINLCSKVYCLKCRNKLHVPISIVYADEVS